MMGRRTWAVLAVAGVAGLVVAMPITLRQMPGPAVSAAPDAEQQTVRVEHEFVSLPASPVPLADAAPAGNVERAAVVPPRRAVPPAPRTAGNKAKRALLGDGRYRPEPFPRPRANGH
jgi:hypothetical protein